jgi:hypothetical protein
MDVYAALGQIGRGEAAAGEQALDILAKSDTYEDVKAEAYYRLALRRAGGPKPDIAAARSLLRKSVECYPMASALLETARLAMQAGDFADARTSVDRLLREFPKTEREFIEEAQQIRRKLMLGGANTGK